MQLIEYNIEGKCRGEKFTIIPIGDIHIGTKNCDVKKFLETVDYIKNTKNCYWLGLGDYAEWIDVHDKRWDASTIDPEFMGEQLADIHHFQLKYLEKVFKPIANKCIGLLEGNHELSIRDRNCLSVVDCLAEALKTKNLTYTAIIRLVFTRKQHTSHSLTVYATHGFGGGLSEGGPINRLVKEAQDFDCDIFLAGHVHKKICIDRDRLMITRSGIPRLIERKQLFGITGTFYRNYVEGSRSYCERKGYSPTPTGTLKITVEPFRCTTITQNGREYRVEKPHLHISA